jgi:glycosyltransferase involved in cell wall biosynthesis
MSVTISVLIPVYNSARYIGQMFEALRVQTFQDFEVVLVYDPGADNSLALINKYAKKFPGCKLIRNEQRCGLPASLNKGLQQSVGEYVFRLDTDDLITPDCLEKEYRLLAADNSLDGVICDELKIDEKNAPKYMLLKLGEDYYIKKQNLFRTAYGGPTTMLRRTKYFEAGLYDERMNISDDKRLALKLHKITKLGHVPERLYLYREHGGNMSQKIFAQKQQANYKLIMQEYYKQFTLEDYVNDWEMVRRFKTLPLDYLEQRCRQYSMVILKCALKLAKLGRKELALAELEKARYINPQIKLAVFEQAVKFGFKKYLDTLYLNMNVWTDYVYDDFQLVRVGR